MTKRLGTLFLFCSTVVLVACSGNEPLPITPGDPPAGTAGSTVEDNNGRAGATPPNTSGPTAPGGSGMTTPGGPVTTPPAPPPSTTPPTVDPVPPPPKDAGPARDAPAADGGAGGIVCGGIAGLRCPANMFCDVPNGTCGAADQTGFCRVRPEVCTLQYAPVCGCDGKTYGNDCQRAGAGVSKLHDGECKAAGTKEVGLGESCGGFRPAPVPVCARGLFCETKPETCGLIADAPGICAERPTVCTKELAPVCGCDGMTYPNDCMRRAAGVSLKSKGACPTKPAGGVGAFCGGIAGLPCGPGLVCDQTPGMCKGADIGGTCKEKPGACTREYKPVCGCDGKTYGNDCTRLAAGVPKNHDGACATTMPPPPPPKLLPAGVWGGRGISLAVKDPVAGAAVELDCAIGTIPGPLDVLAEGQFKWRGTYTRGGGPDPADGRPSVGATYYGRVSGEVMSLEIYVDGVNTPAKYELALGKMPLLVRCL